MDDAMCVALLFPLERNISPAGTLSPRPQLITFRVAERHLRLGVCVHSCDFQTGSVQNSGCTAECLPFHCSS